MAKKKNLRFDCPRCHTNTLALVEIGVKTTSIIKSLDNEGNFDCNNNPILEDGELSNFQCFQCGYILKGYDDEIITDNMQLVYWLEDNCDQKKKQ